MEKQRGVQGRQQRCAWPPAARSRRRKSATVVMPVRSAMTLGSPNCRVKGAGPAGPWRTVCPCDPSAHFAAIHARALQQIPRSRGEGAAEFNIERSGVHQSARASRQASRARAGAVRRNRGKGSGDDLDARLEARQHRVDGVGAGARDQAEVQLGGRCTRSVRAGELLAFDLTRARQHRLHLLAEAGQLAGWQGSGLGSVTVSGSRCTPPMRNS